MTTRGPLRWSLRLSHTARSLLGARRQHHGQRIRAPWRQPRPRAPWVFGAPPAKGAERVKIGYRRVRVSSKPDAVRSVELGRLERGDEVEILESYEGFLRVQTPNGITGWIQRHTVVGDWEG